jgi:phosphate transport system protein
MTAHTSRAFEAELRDLKTRLLAMGGRCEQLIRMASRALEDRDVPLAHSVEELDRAINAEEMAIDRMTINILALRQPVGRDLRFLITALKVVTDLERIGDEAVNVAERAEELAECQPIPSLQPKLHELADAATRMVRRALDAFVAENDQLAREVLREDDEVDALYAEVLRHAMAFMAETSDRVPDGMRYASCAKYLERVADHATNIAEMVVFMVSGDDVRHFGSSSSAGLQTASPNDTLPMLPKKPRATS